MTFKLQSRKYGPILLRIRDVLFQFLSKNRKLKIRLLIIL